MKKNKIIILFLFYTTMLINNNMNAQYSKDLKIGDKVPLFTAFDETNKLWDIKDHIGKGYLVIYFYPAAMTGGCTKQACSYRDSHPEFEKENALVVGISGDEPENLKVFKNAYNLNFPLLSDSKGEIAQKFNVPLGEGSSITREIDGKQLVLKRGVTAKRWTFVINKKGNIIYINQEVDAAKDSEQVLEVLRSEK